MADFALPPQLRNQLERIATAVFKPAGDALFRRGDQGSGAYLIRSGKVRHFVWKVRKSCIPPACSARVAS